MTGRLEINGVNIDINGDIEIPLSFAIADIKQPQNRKRSFSKTVTLPGTKANMAFFSSTYTMSLAALDSDESVGFDFDPTLRVQARYWRNSVLIFDGLVQIMNVNIENKHHTFEVLLFSNFIDLFQALGELKVSELGWSEYDHVLNFDNIMNSWATSVVMNGADTPNFTAGVPDGFGYLYILGDYGYEPTPTWVKDNTLFPHVYWKEIVKKCFAVAGLKVSSAFMETERFKRMVYGWSGGPLVTLTAAEIANRKIDFSATGSMAQDFTRGYFYFVPPYSAGNPVGYYVYDYNQAKFYNVGDPAFGSVSIGDDALSQFDPTTGEIQIARTGRYKLTGSGTLNVTKLLIGTATFSMSTFETSLRLYKNGALNRYLNGSGGNFNFNVDLDVKAGDILELKFCFRLKATVNSEEPPTSAPYWDVSVSDGGDWTFNISSIQAPLINGDTVNVASYLPEQKCSDFIKGVITAYNMYISDPDYTDTVEMEPLGNFYNGTNVFDDWSSKLDYSKKITISPCSNIEGKTYAFKFTQDEDYWNKEYRKEYGIGYGDYNYQVPSTYQQGVKIFELPWAQTVPVNIAGTDLILPTIIARDEITGAVSPFKGKPRVYYYQGLRNCTGWVIRNSANLSLDQWLGQYPAASHIDNYDTPTFDFNFGVPELVQWDAPDYTDVNLFSEYTYKFIKEITGKDSKIMTAYFNLNENDVQIKAFKTFAMIDGVLYRKNIIKDYQATRNESTMVELVRIVEAKKRRSIPPRPLSGAVKGPPVSFSDDGFTGNSPSPVLVKGEVDKADTTIKVRYG